MIAIHTDPLTNLRVASRSMGDTQAQARLRTFVDTEYGKVVAAVGIATGDRDGAADAVHDALVKFLRDGHDPQNLAAWTTVVAVNEVRQRVRRSVAEKRAVGRTAERLEPMEAEGVAMSVDIKTAVEQLPDQQREVVLLHYYLDVSVADTAASLGIAAGTVKTHLHRARATLAQTLSPADEDLA